MNHIILIGNVGKDPEARTASTGTAMSSFSIAISRFSKNDEKKPIWLSCKAFNRTAEIINQYVKKGNKLAIAGHIDEETWVDKNTGDNRSKLVIIVDQVELITPKSDNQQAQQQKYTPPPQDSDYIPGSDEPDVIPF